MLAIYPAIFHKEEMGGFWVEFPDLAGCNSEGDTLPEAMEQAQDALGAYLGYMLDEGKTMQEPTDIAIISVDDGFVNYITCDANKFRQKNKAIKKTLTISEWLNEEAEKRHLNFSAILKNALLQEIQN